MNREDWNKFVKVFNLDVDVTVTKEVRKSDVILALLDEGEIAFNGGNQGKFVLKVSESWTFKMLKTLVWDSIRKYVKEEYPIIEHNKDAKVEQSEQGDGE